MNRHYIVALNAVAIFPFITILSSMKMIMGQVFNISMKYNTIISYAGIISALRFLLLGVINKYSIPYFPKTSNTYKQWVFLGDILMFVSIFSIYLTLIFNPFNSQLKLMLFITFLSTIMVAGEAMHDAAVSVFYTNSKNITSTSDAIFIGHKLAALLGYFAFPLAVYYLGIHIPFILAIILSFFLAFTVFALPDINNKASNKKIENMGDVFKDIKNKENLVIMLAIVTTCQLSTLVLSGIKCNFIAMITKKPLLSYLLRGLSVIVGLFGGYLTHNIKRYIKLVSGDGQSDRQDKITFIIGGLLQLLSIFINYIALTYSTTYLLTFSVVIENLSKGFLMYCLNTFFIRESNGKAHLLTFLWGYFQIVRSVASGVSGILFEKLGTEYFFVFLVFLCLPPIFLPIFLKSSNQNKP